MGKTHHLIGKIYRSGRVGVIDAALAFAAGERLQGVQGSTYARDESAVDFPAVTNGDEIENILVAIKLVDDAIIAHS